MKRIVYKIMIHSFLMTVLIISTMVTLSYATGDILVSTFGKYPAIAMDASGNFVIAWAGKFCDGDVCYTAINARRYDSTGNPVGPEIVVDTGTSEIETFEYPSVAMDTNGNFVIAWDGWEPILGETFYYIPHNVYARRYDSSGNPLGSVFKVNTDTKNSLLPSVAMDANGNFIIVFHNDSEPAENYPGDDVWGNYVQRYDSAGNPLGSVFKVNTNAAHSGWRPAAAMDANGNFVITYDVSNSMGNVYAVFAQRYDSAGNPIGTEFQVNTSQTSCGTPSIAMGASGNFIIVYTRPGVFGLQDSYAQRYDSSGNPVGTEFKLNAISYSQDWPVSVAMDASENFVVTWHTDLFMNWQHGVEVGQLNGFGIYGHRFDSADNPVGYFDESDNHFYTWQDFRVNTQVLGDQRYPKIAMAANGNFVIVWDTETGAYQGIFMKTYFDLSVNTYYEDLDEDGYGDQNDAYSFLLAVPPGVVLHGVAPNNTDCNDSNPSINPGANDNFCDGIDNNCNGQIDEEYTVTQLTCGTGACQRTVDDCVNGIVQTCSPGNPSPEICNNIDDDCNGLTDDNLTQSCYTGPVGTLGVGVCKGGTQTCSAGIWGVCTDELPSAEICNGVDDDCNGIVDDNCVYCFAEAGDGSSTAVWRPDLPVSGIYRVYAKWVAQTSNTTNATYTINCAGGSQVVSVNQWTEGGEWHSLGEFPFEAGTSGSVVLSNAYANGNVTADSVRFVFEDDPGIEIISYHKNAVFEGQWTCELFVPVCIDNDNDGYGVCPYCGISNGCLHDGNDCDDTNDMVNPGKTETCNGIDDDCSGMKDDCHGLENDCCDYCYAEAGDGSSTAVWRPDLPAAGTYRVYAKWVAHADNTTAARYTIFFEGGSQDVLVNQRMGEGEWHLLGIWTFAAGTIGSVVLHNDTADGKVIADSVKFVLWDDPNPGIEIISYHENAVLGGPWTCELYCRDDDNDGFGKCPDCGIVYGCIHDGNDCNDKNASINPAATEVCDGVDNNCNGVIDEGLGTTTCGVGACQVTISNCIDGVPQVCVPLSPTAEICDGIDNDCNGVIDDGLTRPTSCGVGACAGNTGIETCSAGTWGNNTCNPFAGATAEICDGVDNNCNGAVDEGLTRPTTCGVGACAGNTGTETCTAGTWGNNTCNPLAGASAEICDGIDNDCNGVIDDGLTRPTSCGVGACAGNTGIETCSAGTWGNNTCNPFAGATAEICDGIDDDCDGVIPANEADTDGDGIRDCNDNCPNVRNPDQRNVDGDINGDMCDICPADSSDTCDINKSASCSIGASGGTCATTDGSITIIIPPGALDSETSLSITGIGSEYELSTNQGQATALYGLNIQPEGLQFLAPVTMIFRWNDTDNDGKIDSTNIKEEHLLITKNNNALTGRCGQDAGCDMAANTFTFQVLGLSEFVLLVLNNEPAVGNISSQLPDDPLETPRQVNTEIDVIASFTDTGFTDSHTAAWDWGDGSTDPGTVNEAGGTGTVSGAHIYAAPGVYTVTLTVTDDDGLVGTGLFQYIVVYDPDGGFVTGGGWINSPTGAYVPDPSLTGKANFGFVSKYKKGATVPTGNTEFQFKVADLNFHSDTYQWLVIAGAKAQYKGTGTINDEGNYGFMLKAIDGDIKGGGGVDKFRIKIWDKDTNDEIVYDNQLGDSDDADPATVIGGGSIVIHK